MSLHPNEILLAPVVSEKSYAQIERSNTYSFRIHPDAHKTQVRQAVEELFDVKVLRVNVLKVQPKPKRRGFHKGTQARLEEGDRAAAAGRHDRDLHRGSGLMAIRRYKPTSPGRRFMTVSSFEEVTKPKPEKALTTKLTKKGGRNNKGRITTRHQGGGHKRRYRVDRLQAPRRTASRQRSRRSSTTRTARRGSRCCTTRTVRRATSSPRRGCVSARPSSPARRRTSSRATRSRSRTSRPARSSTTSSSSRAGAARWRAAPARASSSWPRTTATACCGCRPARCAACRSRVAPQWVRSVTSTTRTSRAARQAAAAGRASARPCEAPP